MLLSGTKVAFAAASRPDGVTDAGILAGMTFLWRSAWCFLWLVGAIAALMIGAAILIRALAEGWNHAHEPRATGVMMIWGPLLAAKRTLQFVLSPCGLPPCGSALRPGR